MNDNWRQFRISGLFSKDGHPEQKFGTGNLETLGDIDREELLDFYNKYDPLDITGADRRGYNDWIKGLDPEELKMLSLRKKFYVEKIFINFHFVIIKLK